MVFERIFNNPIIRFFSQKPTWLLLVIALVSNILYFDKGLDIYGLSWDNLYKQTGDSDDYINSVENLLEGEGFHFFKTSEDTEFVSNLQPDGTTYNEGIYYAFRSPGFAFFYLPLRWLFSKHISLLLFLGIQILAVSIAKVYIAKTGYLVTKSNWVFYGIFLSTIFTPYFSQYQNLLLTESLGITTLVLFAYLFLKSFSSNERRIEENIKLWKVFLSGFFLILAIMLRPFLVLFALPVFAFLVIRFIKHKRNFILPLIYFTIPIAIIGGSWTIRNYVVSGNFIPLASTMEFQNHKHKAFFEMREYSKLNGLSDRWFETKSPVFWLITREDQRPFNELVTGLSAEEINFFKKFKSDFHHSLKQSTKQIERIETELRLEKELNEINHLIKKEDLFSAVIAPKINTAIELLNQPNLRFYHASKYPINVLLVTVQSFILKLTFIIGLVFSVAILFMVKNQSRLWLLIVPSLLLILFFSIEQATEFREFYTFSMFLLLFAWVGFWESFKKSKRLGWITIILSFCFAFVLGVKQMISEINW